MTFVLKMLIVLDVSIKNEMSLLFPQLDFHLKVWFNERISIKNCPKV